MALPLLKKRHQKKGLRRCARSHLGVLLAADHRQRGRLGGIGAAVAGGCCQHGLQRILRSIAVPVAAGDDVHRGELHAAVGGEDLRDVCLGRLAHHRVAVAAAAGGGGPVDMHSEMYCSVMHPRPLLLHSAGSLLTALLPLMRATRLLVGFLATTAIAINLSKHKAQALANQFEHNQVGL